MNPNRAVAFALAVTFGFVGAHWFYVGRHSRAVIYAASTALAGLLWVISIVSALQDSTGADSVGIVVLLSVALAILPAVVSVVDGLWFLSRTDDEFRDRYGERTVNSLVTMTCPHCQKASSLTSEERLHSIGHNVYCGHCRKAFPSLLVASPIVPEFDASELAATPPAMFRRTRL